MKHIRSFWSKVLAVVITTTFTLLGLTSCHSKARVVEKEMEKKETPRPDNDDKTKSKVDSIDRDKVVAMYGVPSTRYQEIEGK